MANTARKARKRAGIKFTPKAPKTPTPVTQRSFVLGEVFRKQGDAWPAGTPLWQQLRFSGRRSPKRAAAFIASGGIKR